ncbi:hypothetical protein OAS86_03065 [Gammaproteobacteria bacterium]|nr:hypothetical protein [Gammaproteobacteria bacterium]
MISIDNRVLAGLVVGSTVIALVAVERWPTDASNASRDGAVDPQTVTTLALSISASIFDTIHLSAFDDPQAIFVDQPRNDLSRDLLDSVRRLAAVGDTVQARQLLVRAAARAVESGHEESLMWILNWLGRVNLVAGEPRGARAHIDEALKVAMRLNHPEGVANAYLQLGRVEQSLREQARGAGQANDLLHLGRTLRGRGRTVEARTSVIESVQLNRQLGRVGAAASGLELLATMARTGGTRQQWLDHTHNAARQWVRAGQQQRAAALLDDATAWLSAQERETFQRLLNDEQQRLAANESQRHQISEFLSLYRHFAATGDERRAWAFRVKADEARGDDAAHKQYRRKPEVMAVLYSSNSNLDSARRNYQQAIAYYQSDRPEFTSSIYALADSLR